MTYAIRCKSCGCLDTVDVPGRHACSCGAMNIAYQCGVPTRREGMPNTRAPFHRFFSMQHGEELTSWTQYHRLNKQMNLIDTGEKVPQCPIGKTARSYAGKVRRH